MKPIIERHDTDILILGTGGAGLFAALHAQKAAPEQKVTIAWGEGSARHGLEMST